jgi:probable blue pigment (indigoidine) exporter
MIWGSTYYVTTEFLPAGYPLTVAMLRALPIGLLLLLVVRQLPSGIWWIPNPAIGWTEFLDLLVAVVRSCISFTGLTYVLWFRGVSRIEPSAIATLGFLSPLSAVIIGWLLLDQTLNAIQIGTVFAIFVSLYLSQRASRPHADGPGAGEYLRGHLGPPNQKNSGIHLKERADRCGDADPAFWQCVEK